MPRKDNHYFAFVNVKTIGQEIILFSMYCISTKESDEIVESTVDILKLEESQIIFFSGFFVYNN